MQYHRLFSVRFCGLPRYPESIRDKAAPIPHLLWLVKKIMSEYPAGRDSRASKIEYLFSVSFPLAGNPSDLLGIAKKILDKPE